MADPHASVDWLGVRITAVMYPFYTSWQANTRGLVSTPRPYLLLLTILIPSSFFSRDKPSQFSLYYLPKSLETDGREASTPMLYQYGAQQCPSGIVSNKWRGTLAAVAVAVIFTSNRSKNHTFSRNFNF